MPEISKFEERIIDFQQNIDNFNQIILRFDENLSSKVDKLQFSKLEGNLKSNYVANQDLDKYKHD